MSGYNAAVEGAGKKRGLRGEQGRTPYDGIRPYSALTHGTGAVFAVVGTVFLLIRAFTMGSAWQVVSFFIYGFSMIALYTMSTLYHSVKSGVIGRVVLRKLDHTMIYILIAGTYTPVCLIALNGPWGYSLLPVIWTMGIGGIVLNVFWANPPRKLSAGLYIGMGWMALIAIYPLVKLFPPEGLFWLFGGGVFYTVGGVMYAAKWPFKNNRYFGCHEIFHVMCILGSVCHFFMMYRVIAFIAV